MPYNMKKDGNEWCVYNSDTGEKKGCSPTRAKAVGHMRALYAVEGGAKMGNKEASDAAFLQSIRDYEVEFEDVVPADELEVKGLFSEPELLSYVPYTYATSYDELEEQRKAREEQMRIEGLIGTFPILANNVMASPEIDNSSKAAAIEELAGELVERIKSAGEDDDMEMKAISKREDVSDADKKRAVGEYGNVTYADPKNKKYPIDTEAHIRAAWSYIGMPKNQKKYSPAEVSAIKRRIVAAWKRVIDKKGPQAAEKGLVRFARKLKELLSSFDIEEDESLYDETKLFVWKEGETWLWIAQYSNNFRDNDNPPEIIASRSHRRFVERVEKGLAPYPELWLWHVKEWKSGQSTWVGYDESGIAMAAGYFYPWASPVAEWLSKQDDLAVSHGMPPETIVYEDGDVIVEHETREISPLPGWSAANKHTGFVTFGSFIKEESEMAIPKEQKKKLVESMGLSDAAIAAIEKANAAVAKEASDAGLESKEGDVATPAIADVAEPLAGESAPPPPVESATPVEGEEEAEPEAKEAIPSVKEIADAIATILTPFAERVELLEKSVSDLSEKLKDVDQLETKAAEAIATTSPVASLVAMITSRAIGSPAAQVKEGDPIADSKPKEAADVQVESRTGIPFIDTILSQK